MLVQSAPFKKYQCVTYDHTVFSMFRDDEGAEVPGWKLLFKASSREELQLKMEIAGISEDEVYFIDVNTHAIDEKVGMQLIGGS